MKRLYNYAQEHSTSLTPEIARLVVEAYDIKKSDEVISHFEQHH